MQLKVLSYILFNYSECDCQNCLDELVVTTTEIGFDVNSLTTKPEVKKCKTRHLSFWVLRKLRLSDIYKFSVIKEFGSFRITQGIFLD